MGSKPSSVLQDVEIKIISSETGFSASQINKLHSRFCQLDKKNRGFIGKDEFLSIPELAVNPLRDRLLNAIGATDGSNLNSQTNGIDFVSFIKNLAIFLDVWVGTKITSVPSRMADDDPEDICRTASGNVAIKSTSFGDENAKHRRKLFEASIKGIAPTEGIDLTKFNPIFNRFDDKYQLDGSNMDNSTNREKLLFLFKLYDSDNDGRISFIDLRSLIKTLVGNCMDDIELDKIALRAFVEVDEHSDGFIDFGEFCQVFEGEDLDNKLRVKFFH